MSSSTMLQRGTHSSLSCPHCGADPLKIEYGACKSCRTQLAITTANNAGVEPETSKVPTNARQ